MSHEWKLSLNVNCFMWHILHISDLNRVNSAQNAHIILHNHNFAECKKIERKKQQQRARVAQQHQTAVTSTPTTCRLYIYLSKINYTLTLDSAKKKKKTTTKRTLRTWKIERKQQTKLNSAMFFMIFVEPWYKSGCSWNLTQKKSDVCLRSSFTHMKTTSPKKIIISF